MTKRLDAIRAIRNAVVKPLPPADECSGGKKKVGRLARKTSKKKKVVGEQYQQPQQFQSPADPAGRSPQQGVTAFELWMDDVTEAIKEFTGMSLDILPVMPWDKWFQSGMSAVKASRKALRKAESEGESFDPDAQLDEDDDEEEVLPPTLRQRGGGLRKRIAHPAASLEKLAGFLESFDFVEEEEETEIPHEEALDEEGPPHTPIPGRPGRLDAYEEIDRAEVGAAFGAVVNEEKRLEEKRQRSTLKQQRKKVSASDYES